MLPLLDRSPRGRRRHAALVPLAAIAATAGVATAPAPAGAAKAPAGQRAAAPHRLSFQAESARVLRRIDRRLPKVSVGGVLRDANRATRPGVGALRPVPRGIKAAFSFDGGDSSTDKWYPQGITGTGDATASGLVDGRRALAVSWYAKNPSDSGPGTIHPGVRISFITAEDLSQARYRHVLLVVPRAGRRLYTHTSSHAGGIAWVGPLLYVAETGTGLSVYDTRRIYRVRTGSKRAMGCSGSACQAADYKYVMPRVGVYQQRGAERTFSSVAVDRSTSSLVTGEYRADATGGIASRYPLGGDSRLAANAAGGATAPTGSWAVPVPRVQGIVTRGTRAYLSTSGSDAHLYTGAWGASSLTATDWPHGPEDLTYAPGSNRIYSVTEHPSARAVFAVDAG
ncbi:hypothetical protein SK069_10410 [Patulibacter brassicae]|uniref:Secreted protein n=1 Tax=Patulibacter brassicae TaxID=1705717 RepID=A0ABU4VJJ0_9ACTN|nr:hypothetical protein [Patulibacter brassicae]MDX8152006.1 hypothetical protein [Patulibacter brassicae]